MKRSSDKEYSQMLNIHALHCRLRWFGKKIVILLHKTKGNFHENILLKLIFLSPLALQNEEKCYPQGVNFFIAKAPGFMII
jgi:hypothetical protein